MTIGNRDIISVTWKHPIFDGGSPVLGFQIWMKTQTDSDYILVQDGEENPTLMSFATTTDHLGNPITPDTYLFKVSARNWVGTSDLSEALTVSVPYLISPEETQLSGDGLIQIFGSVTSTVTVLAYDEAQIRKYTGGDVYFLHVDNVCFVTDNYRCDSSSLSSDYSELPLFIEFTDNSDGSYSCEYAMNRDGLITVAVVLARKGGLYAEYFNNAFLSGVPTLTKVES
jgi:hypothetical protein